MSMPEQPNEEVNKAIVVTCSKTGCQRQPGFLLNDAWWVCADHLSEAVEVIRNHVNESGMEAVVRVRSV